ncbi:MAG: hypothetical protein QE263_07360 [Vampirovibrionales bacterium]|nr:hypothetical protein [Vampirovibrionales bacterium]
MADPFPSFNLKGPLDITLSTKTMKSICRWADRNKDNKLTTSEIDRAKKRLVQMKYTPQQQAQQQKQFGVSYEHLGYRYGHYLEAAREAKKLDYSSGSPPTGSAFFINAIDSIAQHDGINNTISSQDWYRYSGMM